jgi:hypothetical protein
MQGKETSGRVPISDYLLPNRALATRNKTVAFKVTRRL